MTEITFKDRNGKRWYRDLSNPSQIYIGVTSALEAAASPGLTTGKVNGVAMYAAKHRHELADLTQAEAYATLRDQDTVLPDWRIAAEFGTATHKVIENVQEGKPPDFGLHAVRSTTSYPVNNTFAEWAPQYWAEFTSKHHVRHVMAEQTVVNDELGVAGRFDSILEVDGRVTIVDTKTNKGGPKPSVALQNKAYTHRTVLKNFVTGKRKKMIEVEASGVFWLREEGWNYVPLPFGDDVYKYFKMHVDMFMYQEYIEKDLVGDVVHADGLQLPTKFQY